jgi:TolB-like protein/thioredoxin-like negative regulator of GroEL
MSPDNGLDNRLALAPSNGCESFACAPRSKSLTLDLDRIASGTGECAPIMKSRLFAELRRRNVFRAAAFYAAAVWALAQGISQLGPAFGIPEWGTRWFLIACAIGFPFWIAFAWFYEFTPEGIKREREIAPHESITHHTGRKLDFAIIAVMAVAIVMLVTDRFVLHHGLNEEATLKQGGVDALIESYGDRSIVVLPFLNLSSDPEQEYFADGITEELLNQLAKIRELRVIARTSSFAFKGKNLEVSEIAKQLRVAHVLEGSIRKAGNRVRITAQLIRAADSSHLWSETYDREQKDVFKTQDEIASAVAEQLKLRLLARDAHTPDPKAYALVLKARPLTRLGTAEGYDHAEQLLREAAQIDPGYAEVWDWLAYLSAARNERKLLDLDTATREVRAFVAKALAADPNFAPAYGHLSEIESTNGNLAAAAEALERGIAIDPTSRFVLGAGSTLLADLGRLPESIAIDEYIIALDPANMSAMSNLAESYVEVGRYDDAIASCRTVLALTPKRQSASRHLAKALILSGKPREALEPIADIQDEVTRRTLTAAARHALGEEAAAKMELDALLALHRDAKSVDDSVDIAYAIAEVYAFRGESDRAFEWLARFAADRTSKTSVAVMDERFFDKLHVDSRWTAFLHHVGAAPEQLAKISFTMRVPTASQHSGG